MPYLSFGDVKELIMNNNYAATSGLTYISN
jgi:hypothetical protein